MSKQRQAFLVVQTYWNGIRNFGTFKKLHSSLELARGLTELSCATGINWTANEEETEFDANAGEEFRFGEMLPYTLKILKLSLDFDVEPGDCLFLLEATFYNGFWPCGVEWSLHKSQADANEFTSSPTFSGLECQHTITQMLLE
jgi:hypothetical protein